MKVTLEVTKTNQSAHESLLEIAALLCVLELRIITIHRHSLGELSAPYTIVAQSTNNANPYKFFIRTKYPLDSDPPIIAITTEAETRDKTFAQSNTLADDLKGIGFQISNQYINTSFL